MWETEHCPEVLLHEGRLFLLRMPHSFTRAVLANRKCWIHMYVLQRTLVHSSSTRSPSFQILSNAFERLKKTAGTYFFSWMHLRCSGRGRQVGPLCFRTSCSLFLFGDNTLLLSRWLMSHQFTVLSSICLHSLEDWWGGSCKGSSCLCLSLELV